MRHDIDDTRHDAGYQAELDKAGSRDSWIESRAAEIQRVLLTGGPELAECLQVQVDPIFADLFTGLLHSTDPKTDRHDLAQWLDSATWEYAVEEAAREHDHDPGEAERRRAIRRYREAV